MFEPIVVHGIVDPGYKIDTDDLPYNSIYNITITALNGKARSEDLIIEFMTRPPPITNLSIITS